MILVIELKAGMPNHVAYLLLIFDIVFVFQIAFRSLRIDPD